MSLLEQDARNRRKRLLFPENGRHSDETEITSRSIWLRQQAKKVEDERKARQNELEARWRQAIEDKIAADNTARAAAAAAEKAAEVAAIERLELSLATAGERPVETKFVPVARIIDAVATFYDLNVNELLSVRKTGDLVTARHIVMYLARKFTARSYPQIGRHLGGRDHTTVLHGVARMHARLLQEPNLVSDVARIMLGLGLGSLVPARVSDEAERGEPGGRPEMV